MTSKRPRSIPTTQEGQALQTDQLSHESDNTNPHRTKLGQLSDLTNATTGAAGQMPTLQPDGTYLLTTPPGAAGGAPVGSAVPRAPKAAGESGAGASASREDHAHPSLTFTAEDYGYVAWSVDPAGAASTLPLAAGTLYTARSKVAKTGAIASVVVPITTGAAGVTSAWVAVFAVDGTLLGVSADTGASWVAAGTKTVALTAPTEVLPAGTPVYLAVLAIGGSPIVRSMTAAPTVNQNLSAATGHRFGLVAGQAAMPSPLVMAGMSSSSSPLLLFAAGS